jgi:hypothetical protein
MNVKFSQLRLALDHLRDEIGVDNYKNATLEIVMKEDDPGAGALCECLTVKCTVTCQPSKYDSFTTPSVKEYTIEVFAEDERRPPRMVLSQTRNLEVKEDR